MQCPGLVGTAREPCFDFRLDAGGTVVQQWLGCTRFGRQEQLRLNGSIDRVGVYGGCYACSYYPGPVDLSLLQSQSAVRSFVWGRVVLAFRPHLRCDRVFRFVPVCPSYGPGLGSASFNNTSMFRNLLEEVGFTTGFVTFEFENENLFGLEQEVVPASKRARGASAVPTSVSLRAIPVVY